jgi:hypothetical protein
VLGIGARWIEVEAKTVFGPVLELGFHFAEHLCVGFLAAVDCGDDLRITARILSIEAVALGANHVAPKRPRHALGLNLPG